MARDRWAVLARRAAARGLIDYSRFNPRSRKDLLREKFLLDELEDEEGRALDRMIILRLAPRFADEDFDKACGEVFRRLVLSTIPWLKLSDGKVTEEEAKSLRGAWERQFGSLDDPAVQAALRQYEEKTKQKAKPKQNVASQPVQPVHVRGHGRPQRSRPK